MRGKRYSFISVLFVIATLVSSVAYIPTTHAAQITQRSVTLIGVGANGGSKPGVAANEKLSFHVPSVGNTNIGSIKFEYCVDAAVTSCATGPAGLNAAGATFGNETGSAVTGFSMGTGANGAPAPTTNVVVLTRTSASVTADSLVSVQINNVVNPTNVTDATHTGTFFIRISTYSGVDGATGLIDTGTVAASTSNQIDFTGVMPETLVFCTGITVSANCGTVTTGVVNFGLFSPTQPVTATSQMAASTNAGQGYVITVSGATLTSSGNVVTAIGGTKTTSSPGSNQFGLNLVANTTATSTPAIGANVTPAVAGNYHGTPSANYDTVDNFAFVAGTPTTVAASTVPSAAQVYTVSYLVNVAGNLPPGTYTTTLTYICTPTY